MKNMTKNTIYIVQELHTSSFKLTLKIKHITFLMT